ncbi:MAG: MarR family transcriptional regulator [Lachnospiraceae bacterium]|nr:MarR family transcriptional regulator [Lachnospiraceae bacterium]
MPDKYDMLKIENQLCFPLYASAKEVVKKYRPFLEQIDLTYTQYITMMVLWEYNQMNVKTLGERLYLDSGTLTPLLKKLENKGLVSRKRSDKDERNITVTVTEKGMELREKAVEIPSKIGGCINLSPEEALTLYRLLYKVLGKDTFTEADSRTAPATVSRSVSSPERQ